MQLLDFLVFSKLKLQPKTTNNREGLRELLPPETLTATPTTDVMLAARLVV
jgi:hypothetical protein